MSHTCSCGATFETLTRYRLHQRDDCPDRGPDLDISELDADEIAAETVAELLVCDVCEASNERVERITRDMTDAGLAITVHFECEHCPAFNENTAVLSGGAA